jgi:hypothetical protein
MANRRKKIARKAGASRHFLLSQTDSRRVEDLPEYGVERARNALLAAFPDVLYGHQLRQEAIERLNNCDRFAVIVLRPDEAPAADRADAAAPDGDPLVPIAERLEAACRRTGAFWGIEDSGLLAGYWPNLEAAECVEQARSLQEEIRTRIGRTVMAGVAVHLAARVLGCAGDGEIWVSSTIPGLVIGSPLEFAPRRWRTLKGLPDPVELFALA